MASTYPPENLVEDGIIVVIDMIKDFLDPGEEFVIDEGRDMYAKTRGRMGCRSCMPRRRT